MKIFENIKNRKPLGDKGKGRLQGVAIGLGLAAIAFVVSAVAYGCSSSSSSDDGHAQSSSAQTRGRYLADTYTITSGEYTFVNTPTLYEFSVYINFDAYIKMDCDGTQIVYYQDMKGMEMPSIAYTDGYGWGSGYQTINVNEDTSVGSTFYDWFLLNTGNVSSSSETSSSEESQTSSVEQALDSLDVNTRRFTFAETNPFSAWAVNPLSEERANGYDLGAPWLLYTGSPSGDGATTQVTAKYTTYPVGEFYVNGNESARFDAIALTTLNLSTDNSFVFDGETTAQQVSADMFARGAFIISNVYFVNTTEDTRIKVMDFGSTSATLNGNAVTALTAPRWLNVGFKNIVYVGNNGNVTINGYSAPAVWWLENNGLSQTAGVSTMVLGNSSTGVFGLLASSFGAIASILGISLIPGLTLGTLMFIPLVVLVIFAIIKILNK